MPHGTGPGRPADQPRRLLPVRRHGLAGGGFLLEVGYKTLRYSGKEMDECGLYYYGARYYAPWLQRWVSADPAGEVDGLNLYRFVRNNPLRYVDNDGEASGEAVIRNYSNFISVLVAYATQTLEQIDNIINETNIEKDLLKNLAGNR